MQYLKFVKKQYPIAVNFVQKVELQVEQMPEPERTRCRNWLEVVKILNDNMLQEGRKDLETLPVQHRAAAAADSMEALFYYEKLKQGKSYKEIATEASIYKKFAIAEQITTSHYMPTGKMITADQPRKKLDKAIKKYNPEEVKKSVNNQKITDKRMKQIPFIRGLIAMIDEGIEVGITKEELEKELNYLLSFIANIEQTFSQYEAKILKLRYLNGESWENVAIRLTTTGKAETVRKIAERLMERYNRVNKDKSMA